MSVGSPVADQLQQKSEEVLRGQESKAIEARKTVVRNRNEKAKKLVSRLEECDENIASLLSRAADCLETLTTADTANQSMKEKVDGIELFEARAQEWFANLHEVQIGLRSAVKHLRRAQLPPIALDVSSQTSSTIGASRASGSASRGHSLALLSQYDSTEKGSGIPSPLHSGLLNTTLVNEGLESQSSHTTNSYADNIEEEGKLSLSTLRLQNAGWKQLANSLQSLAAGKEVSSSKLEKESDLTVHPPTESTRSSKAEEKRKISKEAMTALFQTEDTQDNRLLSALFQLDPQ